MKKNKSKKISAKLLLAVFIINSVCIFGFAKPTLADGGVMNLSISDYDIIEGESVFIIWDHIVKDPVGSDSYSDYDTQIYRCSKNIDTEEWSAWTHIASVDWNYQSTQSYSLPFDDGGIYKIKLVQYARRLGHWEKNMYSDYVWVGTTGTWLVVEEISNEINVEYSMNVQLNTMTIDEGDNISLSWQLVSKRCDDYYNGYRCGYIDYDTEIWIQKDSGDLTKITTIGFIGSFIDGKSETQDYTVPIPQAGNYKFILKEYSREKGYWDYIYHEWHGIREDNLLYEEASDTFIVSELLYNFKANPDVIDPGEQTTITWVVNPKNEDHTYISELFMKIDDGIWQFITSKFDIGAHQYPIILNEAGIYSFKIDLFIDNTKITSEFSTIVSVVNELIVNMEIINNIPEVITYDFENENVGTFGTYIDFIDEYLGYTPIDYTDISVKHESDGSNCLYVHDCGDDRLTRGTHYITYPQTNGTIEFTNKFTSPNSYYGQQSSYFGLKSIDNRRAIYMQVDHTYGRYFYFDGSTWNLIADVNPDIWYQHHIEFNCNEGEKGKYSWIISTLEGVEIGRVNNIDFEGDFTEGTIDELYITTDKSSWLVQSFWDDFKLSVEAEGSTSDSIRAGDQIVVSWNVLDVNSPLNNPLSKLYKSMDDGNTWELILEESGTGYKNHTITTDEDGIWKFKVVEYGYFDDSNLIEVGIGISPSIKVYHEKFALVVSGSNANADGTSTSYWNTLTYKFYNLLIDNYDYRRKNVYFLPCEEKPFNGNHYEKKFQYSSEETITYACKRIAKHARIYDEVTVFWNAHGWYGALNIECGLTYNDNGNWFHDATTYYYIDTLLDLISCKNMYIFVDSCLSGRIIEWHEMDEPNRVILTAATDMELMTVGEFTNNLIEGLEGDADGTDWQYVSGNEDGYVSIYELLEYTYIKSHNYYSDNKQHANSFIGSDLPGYDCLFLNREIGERAITNEISRWNMDEGKEFRTFNSIVNYHGTISGEFAWQTQGKYGNCIDFYSGLGGVHTDLKLDQRGSKSYTFSAWVKPTSDSGGRHHVISTDNGGYDWSLLREGGMWYIFTGEMSRNTGFSVDLNEWQHLVVEFIPSLGCIRFYKNMECTTINYISTDSNTNFLYIGKNPKYGEYFQGCIDDVRIFEGTLSQDVITQIYEGNI